jgi:hypothetical protein
MCKTNSKYSCKKTEIVNFVADTEVKEGKNIVSGNKESSKNKAKCNILSLIA